MFYKELYRSKTLPYPEVITKLKERILTDSIEEEDNFNSTLHNRISIHINYLSF